MKDSESVSLLAARNLADFARRAHSDEAQERAILAIADTLGVTIAGSAHHALDILAATILTDTASGPATLLGGTGKVGMLDAALINGTAAHMLDFDDSNSDLFGHLSVAILPALLALAEHRHASGEDFLSAFIAGYEAGCRFGNAFSKFQYTHGWHPTTAVGIFAAVSACAVLAELDEHSTAMAFGIAAHMASGIKSNFGSMTKPLGVGQANRNALMAVLLAQRGFSSGKRVFEHHHGYTAVFNLSLENADMTPLISPWSGREKILDPAKGIKQKRFPCCFAIAPILDCILALRRAHDLRWEQIANIALKVHPIRFPHINVPAPQTSLAAKFSATYCVARAILTGKLGIVDFEDDARLAEAETCALMSKATLGTYSRAELSGADVTITTTDGRVLLQSVDSARGATYQNPLTPKMVRDKFIDAASRQLGDEASNALWEHLTNLASWSDVTALTATMQRREPAVEKREICYG